MKKSIKLVIFLFLALLALTGLVFYNYNHQELKIYFFSVGQGDGIYIRTPSHQNIIIDGGPDNTFIYKLGQALPFYDRAIDLVILTHPHADHLTGLIEVLKRYRVNQVLEPGITYNTQTYQVWNQLLKDKKINVKIALAGQKFYFGQTELNVLYPLKSFAGLSMENINETSVAVKLTYKNSSAIFTGDLDSAGENELVKYYKTSLKADLLKVGHHGSDTSSSSLFLSSVKPADAIISCGLNNKFGLPKQEILNRLKSFKAKIFRTDLMGDLVFSSSNPGFSGP